MRKRTNLAANAKITSFEEGVLSICPLTILLTFLSLSHKLVVTVFAFLRGYGRFFLELKRNWKNEENKGY